MCWIERIWQTENEQANERQFVQTFCETPTKLPRKLTKTPTAIWTRSLHSVAVKWVRLTRNNKDMDYILQPRFSIDIAADKKDNSGKRNTQQQRQPQPHLSFALGSISSAHHEADRLIFNALIKWKIYCVLKTIIESHRMYLNSGNIIHQIGK